VRPELPTIRRPRRENSSVAESVALFEAGHAPAEIASLRGLTSTTIYNHLAGAIESGRITDIDQLVAPQRQAVIADAIARVGDAFLAPVREHLGESYSYDEIRIVRARLLATRTQESGWPPSGQDPPE
jgi:ATP-dependent DNA helicase RecQ